MNRTEVDLRWLRRSRVLAEQARSSGNTPVGSVVATGDLLIAEASEAVPAGPDPFAHAEFVAVREAMQGLGGGDLRKATVYTTAEPCFMCSYAIREAHMGRGVIVAATPWVGGATSRYPILAAADVPRWGPPPEVVWWPETVDAEL